MKDLGRIKHIMGKYYFKQKYKQPTDVLRDMSINRVLDIKDNTPIETFPGVEPDSVEHNERMMVFRYYYKIGTSDREIEAIWNLTQHERRQQRKVYKLKPKRERKDNQNPLTNTKNYGSGYASNNPIRVPSKKHKNRFKNFLKLFPMFKDKV